MIRRIFINKCNSIIRDSNDNFGLNPTLMLSEGAAQSRGLVQIDTDKISALKDSNDFGFSNIRYTLKMYNYGSIDKKRFGDILGGTIDGADQVRATGMTIVAFRIPKIWDRGIGFDNTTDVWYRGDACVSTQGSNWKNASNGVPWDTEGIISDDDLLKEYDKYQNGEETIIVATQHLDSGSEDLELDVTDYINKILSGSIPNRGLCITFLPLDYTTKKILYTGFFTDKTRTFYEPFVEMKSEYCINDARNNFILGKANRLYLYFYGDAPHADFMPVCTIDGVSYPVVRASEKVFYVTVKLGADDYEDEQEVSDVWSNITFDGEHFETFENYFFVKRIPLYGGKAIVDKSQEFFTISGIKDDEKLLRGDERTVQVTLKIPYTGMEKKPSEQMAYNIYVEDAYRNVKVIDGDGINITPDSNYFTIYTEDLLPQEYHVDIQIGNRTYKDQLTFRVVDKLNNPAVY